MTKESPITTGGRTLRKSPNVRWYEHYDQPMFWDQFLTRGIDPEGTATQAGEIIGVRGKVDGSGQIRQYERPTAEDIQWVRMP